MSELRERVEWPIEGMTCASCAARVEKRLNRLDGVEASVNYATERAAIAYDAERIGTEELLAAVERAGYHAAPASPEATAASENPATSLLRRLQWTAALSLPVLVLSMVPALQFDSWQWLVLVLATPAVLWGGWPFHRAAWLNLRHRTATMDTLVSLGTLAAWGWSVAALLFGPAGDSGMRMGFELLPDRSAPGSEIYFEVAAVVVTFLLAGRYFEASAKGRAGAALRSLLELGAREATVLTDDGREQRVPVEQLRVGQRFLVRPGERVATDGEVEEGASAVDESLLTGESVPVEKAPADPVAGGTVNLGGRLIVRAQRVGADTALAQIARLVSEAQSGKAPVQRLADRVAGVFVPIVILIALSAFGGWLVAGEAPAFALTAAVSVLIIACPCALGLATPTALLVGTGRGAQLGLLIRGPEILESTRRVDTVLLDKTGTVTTGRMALVGVTAEGVDPDRALRLAAALERSSEHPVARAIAAQGEDGAGPRVDSFANLPGAGVEGSIDGRALLIGRPELLAERGIDLPAALERAIAAHSEQGITSVVLASDGWALAVFAVADALKPTSAEAVTRLRTLGLTPVLLTGDNARVAEAVAARVGIDQVVAGVLPAGKAAVVTRLQEEGRVVAMVGDGVNDAPALAAADLGIAIGTGTDVAIEASDLTLTSGDLRSAADAIELARRTLRTIRVNLFWAFAYNVALIPAAALGLLNPLLAGAAMALSSVLVVSNSLRLRSYVPSRRGAAGA